APTLSNLNLDKTVVNEGDSVTLSGLITDPGILDTFTVRVDWGDGTTSQQTVGAGAPVNFSISHTYADADPTANPFGLMNVQVQVKDKDMTSFGAFQSAGTVVVNNVPPTIAGLAITPSINEGDVATLTGNVVDPSPGDTFTMSVDWGDGTVDTFTPQVG